MFQQTPQKPAGISRIPVIQSIKRPECLDNFLQPTSIIDTTCSSLLEPMVRRLDTTNDSQVFRKPLSVSSSISDDIRTEQFDIHLDAIKNSTIGNVNEIAVTPGSLSAFGNIAAAKDCSRFEQQSLHIKDEQMSEIEVKRFTNSKSLAARLGELSVSYSEEDLKKMETTQTMENSIYVKRTSLDAVDETESWSEVEDILDNDDAATICIGTYLRHSVDLNQTELIIEEHMDTNSDPFDEKVQKAFLEKHDLMGFVERDVDSCQMVNTLRPLRPNMTVPLNERKFTVMALIGKGAYGSVYR